MSNYRPDVSPSWEEATDEELIGSVARRNVEAFEELYRRHAVAVHALSRRLFSDPDLAAEVTHVAFLKLWERSSNLHAESGLQGKSRLRAWLTTVAHNAAIDRQRRKGFLTIPLMEARDSAAQSPGPDVQVIMADERRDIRAALRNLPASQRDAIELSFFGGLSQSEIANLTGEALGTVKGRIRLGMRRLKALMTTGEPA